MIQVFEFTEYKAYLCKAINTRAKTQRGVRSRVAEALSCRPGYITQVLDGDADLSLEQADLASLFFGHTDEESQYFLFLVIHGRAGTKRLKQQIEKQIKRIREQHLNLKDRFQVKTISEQDQLVFYSNWQHLAVLTMLSVPGLQTKESLSEKMRLPLRRISEIIALLENTGMVVFKNGKYLPCLARTHLGKDSPMISKHHLNWRMQAIQSIERQAEGNLHYSSVVSLSEKDVLIIRERLIQMIEEIARIVGPSPEESVRSLCLDFFEL